MKKEYELKGMLQNTDVEEAEVHLHPQTAILTMSKAIDISELQAQLNKAGHYTINEKN